MTVCASRQRLYQCLAELKSEVEYVIRTGRKVVEDGVCDDPARLTARLDALKALYNQVCARAAHGTLG